MKALLRYTRYALATLATVAFGIQLKTVAFGIQLN